MVIVTEKSHGLPGSAVDPREPKGGQALGVERLVY